MKLRKKTNIYLCAPILIPILLGLILFQVKDNPFFNSASAEYIVNTFGNIIPMIKDLKNASNYTIFFGMAYSIFWIFIPLICFCGWQTTKYTPDMGKEVLCKQTKKRMFFSFVIIFVLAAFSLCKSIQIDHKNNHPILQLLDIVYNSMQTTHPSSTDTSYLYNNTLAMIIGFYIQSLPFYLLGMMTRFIFIERNIYLTKIGSSK